MGFQIYLLIIKDNLLTELSKYPLDKITSF